MNAEQVAREIRNELWQLGHLKHEKITGEVEGIIAARLAPLVSDAEKYRKLMEINDRMQKCMGYDD